MLNVNVPRREKAARDHQDPPGSAVPEDTANFALVGMRTAADLSAKFRGKRSQALIADLEADFGHRPFGGEQLPGTIHAKAGEEVMRGLAECSAKKAMEVEFGEARLASCVLEQNPGRVCAG